MGLESLSQLHINNHNYHHLTSKSPPTMFGFLGCIRQYNFKPTNQKSRNSIQGPCLSHSVELLLWGTQPRLSNSIQLVGLHPQHMPKRKYCHLRASNKQGSEAHSWQATSSGAAWKSHNARRGGHNKSLCAPSGPTNLYVTVFQGISHWGPTCFAATLGLG